MIYSQKGAVLIVALIIIALILGLASASNFRATLLVKNTAIKQTSTKLTNDNIESLNSELAKFINSPNSTDHRQITPGVIKIVKARNTDDFNLENSYLLRFSALSPMINWSYLESSLYRAGQFCDWELRERIKTGDSMFDCQFSDEPIAPGVFVTGNLIAPREISIRNRKNESLIIAAIGEMKFSNSLILENLVDVDLWLLANAQIAANQLIVRNCRNLNIYVYSSSGKLEIDSEYPICVLNNFCSAPKTPFLTQFKLVGRS